MRGEILLKLRRRPPIIITSDDERRKVDLLQPTHDVEVAGGDEVSVGCLACSVPDALGEPRPHVEIGLWRHDLVQGDYALHPNGRRGSLRHLAGGFDDVRSDSESRAAA